MRLGIDFGTTHTVATLVDRGNYPVIGFEWGDTFPSLLAVAEADGELRFGPDALAVADQPGWRLVRSFKRLLGAAGPQSHLAVANRRIPLPEILAGHFARLREELCRRSTAAGDEGDELVVALSVPASASSDQRFLTLAAAREAGFTVAALLNEPSAAGFEYAHRFRRTFTSRREHVLVYDLGGGTFDASLIHMAGLANEVVATAGETRLGGDDFDEAIAAHVSERAGAGALDGLPLATRHALFDEVRRQKERLTPQSRRFTPDLTCLGAADLAIAVEEVYAVCGGLVERSLDRVEEVLAAGTARSGIGWEEVASIYVAGGASSFPPVLRRLRERYGEKRVRRSPHPHAATAIGLACFLDEESGVVLRDRLSRTFGVFREAAAGSEVAFDPIFSRDTLLPASGTPPLEVVRRYHAAHNLGHFRFLECGRLREGVPDGAMTPWDEIRFPFDMALRERADLSAVPVVRFAGAGPWIEERYACTAEGTFSVTLTCLDDGWSHRYDLGRHEGRTSPHD